MAEIFVPAQSVRFSLALICTVMLGSGVMNPTLHAQAAPASLGIFEGQSDVGAVTPPGTAAYDAASGTYTLTAAGANLWSTTDAFHFLWKKMAGDVALTADIEFPAAPGEHSPHRKAVLIFRESLAADAAYADAAQHGVGLTALQYRRDQGAITQDIELIGGAPQRLRIEKRGDLITMFVSSGGEPLHPTGASIPLHLTESFYAGIGLCSHDPHTVEKAVFSHVTLEPLAPLPAGSQRTLYSTLQTIGVDENLPQATAVYTAQGHFEAPNWSRDGNTLIFDQEGRIVRVRTKGGTPQPLDTGGATKCNGSHGLSPDGQWLAISCATPGKPESRVYVVPMAGGEPRLVTPHPFSYWHTWSPDGKTIVFTRPGPAPGTGNIEAIPAEGGEEHPLTTGSGISDDPDYSPDGRSIYFNSDRGGSMQIWRMHPDGTSPEQITHDDWVNWTPHPSPDGKYIVFLSYAKGTTGHPVNREIALRLLSVEDGKIRVLVKLIGGSGTINVPSWAPDSRHLAFVSYELVPAGYAGSGFGRESH